MSVSVAMVRCGDYEGERVRGALLRLFELQGGVEKYVKQGETVLIKPNLIGPKPREKAVQTDPAVIYELAKIVKEQGGEPIVGDSPAWNNTAGCIKALGLTEKLAELGAEVRQLDEPVHVRVEGMKVGISRAVLEADRIINLPKLKAHQQLYATIAVKNMYGCVAGKEKAWWHLKRGGDPEVFCRMLIGIYKYLRPAINIVDGVVGMEGMGPIRGTPRELGWLVAGEDPMACEAVMCRMIGFEPEQLPIMRTAKKMDYGCGELERIELVGDRWDREVVTPFEPSMQLPIKFSLYQVIRSVIKQFVMLMKKRFKGAKV